MTDLIDPYLANLAGLIDEYGWACQGVFGDTPEQCFTYTVGLHDKGLPELWLATLSMDQAKPILNELARRSIDAGRLEPGVPVDVGWSVKFRLRGPVSLDDASAFIVRRFYPVSDPEVMQVLWPDAGGRFPDEDGYDAAAFPQRLVAMA